MKAQLVVKLERSVFVARTGPPRQGRNVCRTGGVECLRSRIKMLHEQK